MAAITPFEPDIQSATAGFTQVIVIGTINQAQQVIMNEPTANTLLITGINKNPAGSITAVPYIRLSVESSTVAASNVSVTDMAFPLAPGAQSTVRLFASPAPGGKYVITVTSTLSSTLADGGSGGWRLWFTPGQGGIE